MAKEFKVSQSKVNCYRTCRYKYFLKYVEKLRRRKVKRPFQFGRMVHEMLEADANGDDPFELLGKISFDNKKLFTAEKEMYGEIVKDVELIMREYFEHYKDKEIVYQRRKGRSAEHEFNVEIADGLVATGKLDGVGKLNRLKWLVEHKTFTNMPNEDHRWKNLQSAVYLKMLQKLDWFPGIDGILWNYVRSKPPGQPKLLKSGKMSEKAVDTLPSVVTEVLKKYKLKEKDYPKLVKGAKESRKKYFSRIFQPVNQTVINHVFKGFVDTAKEIRDTHGKKFDKNIGRHCDWCDFEPICRAQLTGGDSDFVKEREYIKDVKVESEKEAVEEAG